jgi:hypothetical protein
MRYGKFLLTALAVLLGGSAHSAPPEPVKSEYLQSLGGGFTIDARQHAIRCGLHVGVRKQFDEMVLVKAEFENPEPGAAPLVAYHRIRPGSTNFYLSSPEYPGIRNGKTYTVTLYLYHEGDETDGEAFSKHEQGIEFRMPPAALDTLGITTY